MKQLILAIALICAFQSCSQTITFDPEAWTTVNGEAISGEHPTEEFIKVYLIDGLSVIEFGNLNPDNLDHGTDLLLGVVPRWDNVTVEDSTTFIPNTISYRINVRHDGCYYEGSSIFITEEHDEFADLFWDMAKDGYITGYIVGSEDHFAELNVFNISLMRFTKHAVNARLKDGDPGKVMNLGN